MVQQGEVESHADGAGIRQRHRVAVAFQLRAVAVRLAFQEGLQAAPRVHRGLVIDDPAGPVVDERTVQDQVHRTPIEQRGDGILAGILVVPVKNPTAVFRRQGQGHRLSRPFDNGVGFPSAYTGGEQLLTAPGLTRLEPPAGQPLVQSRLDDRLQQAVARTLRSGNTGALFFLDLDRFKNVNDNLGHHIGDDLLKQVSERLLDVCRASDTLARLGGDEFTLVVEGLDDVGQLAMIAEKILHAFAEPFSLDTYKLEISVSIGISVFPKDSSDVNELIRHADTAMYSAKESGRNTYRFYTQELTTNAFEYFAMEIALQKAIEALSDDFDDIGTRMLDAETALQHLSYMWDTMLIQITASQDQWKNIDNGKAMTTFLGVFKLIIDPWRNVGDLAGDLMKIIDEALEEYKKVYGEE